MINVKNRVPAEVFLWHPHQRQLHGNTPTKQRKSRNFKSLNIITQQNLKRLINEIILRSYHKCSNCCPSTGTQGQIISVFSIRLGTCDGWVSASWDTSVHPAWPLASQQNSLDLNPVDYCIRGRVQHHVYQKPVKDVDQLKQRLIEVWSGLQQTVVNEAIDEWRRRLRACVRVKGQQFEHLL